MEIDLSKLEEMSFSDLIGNMAAAPAPKVKLRAAGVPKEYPVVMALLPKLQGFQALTVGIVQQAAHISGMEISPAAARKALDYAVSVGVLESPAKGKYTKPGSQGGIKEMAAKAAKAVLAPAEPLAEEAIEHVEGLGYEDIEGIEDVI